MKYEEIKVGESYKSDEFSEMKVKLKHDELKEVVVSTYVKGLGIFIMTEDSYKHWKPFTPELPDEGLVVLKGNKNCIIYRTGKETGYGFRYGMYYIVEDENSDERWSFKSFAEKWRPATEEEESKFIDLLKKECERRGLYEDTKIKTQADGSKSFNTVNYTLGFNLYSGYNINGLIFFKGKFAEPLEEDQTLDTKIKELINVGKEKGLKINVTFE